MIAACKQKFCPACDGTEPSDFQMIMVDRIHVNNIILFKVLWIMHKIMIDRIVANLYIRIADDIFQIHDLMVMRPSTTQQ